MARKSNSEVAVDGAEETAGAPAFDEGAFYFDWMKRVLETCHSSFMPDRAKYETKPETDAA